MKIINCLPLTNQNGFNKVKIPEVIFYTDYFVKDVCS